MMQTNELIATLASNMRPLPRVRPRLAMAVLAGGALALGMLAIVLGSPLDPVEARGIAASAVKLAYPLAVGMIAVAAALAAGRPGARIDRRLSLLALPLLMVAIAAIADLTAAPPADRDDLLFGTTYVFCITAVTLTSVPAFLALNWAFRSLAPTRPALAGFLIGLGAGGAAAAAYALYCPELSPAFLLAAYTPAMLVPALIGAAMGRRLLRW